MHNENYEVGDILKSVWKEWYCVVLRKYTSDFHTGVTIYDVFSMDEQLIYTEVTLQSMVKLS